MDPGWTPTGPARSDAGFAEFRRQVTYKHRWHGSEPAVANRWFPSPKSCSRCGALEPDLSLSERIHLCESCVLVLDRELNAAINLPGWADPAVTAGAAETPTACGANRETGTHPAGGWEARNRDRPGAHRRVRWS